MIWPRCSAARPPKVDERLNEADLAQLLTQLGSAGTHFGAVDARARFTELRTMYEPYVTALSDELVLALPAWSRRSNRPDNWEAAPWKDHPAGPEPPEHF